VGGIHHEAPDVACALLDEPADEVEDDAERLPLESVLPESLLEDPWLAGLALELVPRVTVVVEPWVEPGSVAATTPVASTLAMPTPTVAADSRFMPRRLSIDGGTGRPPGFLRIGDPFPPGWVCRRGHRLGRNAPATALMTTMRQQVQGYLPRSSELLLCRGSR
jgi:hypothetical protein